MRRYAVCSAVFVPLIGISVLMLSGCGKSEVKRINGGGATFPDPIIQKWSAVYKDSKGIEVDYSKSGSGDGIKNMTSKTLDFGCSDAPMNKEQLDAARAKGGEVIHIPVTIGSVAVVYNIPGFTGQLVLDGKTLGKIYTGAITDWGHPDIAALNPGIPKHPIVAVYRAESSGTTNIFKEFLAKTGAPIKPSTSSSWPDSLRGTGQQGSDGVAGHVKNNAGCIGYVELTYAKKNGIPYAAIRNRAGKDMLPTPEGVTAAAETSFQKPQTTEPYSLHTLTFSLTDADSSEAYPICGMSYAVLFKKQPKDKGKVLVEFLKWATTEGQKFAAELDYAPLPKKLQDDINKRLGEVEFE
jgi:phosphate transport system substrate-binding protein